MIGCCKSRTAKKVCSVIGASFLLAPSIVHFIWGNLSIYVLSYIHRHSPSVSGAKGSWTPSLFLMIQAMTILPTASLIPLIGRKTTAFLGVILFNVGVFCSYFAVESSITAVNLTLGALSGLGGGILYAVCTDYGVQWSGKYDTGVITAAVQNSYNVMAVIVNEFITFYINPHNEVPLVHSGDFTLFSQNRILQRVPGVFLILGSCFFSLQMVGLCMVQDCPLSSSDSSEIESVDDCETAELAKTKDSFNCYGAANSKSPKEMVLTPSFHFMCIAFFTSEFSFMMVTINYKAFGLLWIDNDYFLTTLGTVSVVVIVIVKTIAGIAVDKLGFKLVLIFIYGSITVCSGFLYEAPQVNRWLYSFLVIVLVSLSGSSFLVNTVATILLFGRKHAVVNVSLLNFATILMMLVGPPTMELLMTLSSWPGVFLTGATLSLVGLILTIIGIPSKMDESK